MLNLASKKQTKSPKIQPRLQLSDIEKYYHSNNKDSLVGLEYERLSLDRKTLKNASYDKLEKIFKSFCEITKWDLVYDNDTVIAAISKTGTSISLEPGCQLEISLEAKKDILSIDYETNKIIALLDKIALAYDVIFLGYGISPVSCLDEINVLNKRRYLVMNDYLPEREFGELSLKMMRQSAGIQINVDYMDSSDAFYKLKFFNLIMPFMTALFANSPLENNTLSQKKTLRANIWRYTGSERCNFFYKKIFSAPFAKNNLFKNYIGAILDVPMIFIERDNKIIKIKGKITFKEFLKHGYDGYFATMDDYILHQSLVFPDVRLKKYIEIRNHDSSDFKTALALCAFYKGLVSSDIKKSLSKMKYLKSDDVDEYSSQIISKGLDITVCGRDGWQIIADLFNIAKENLTACERTYLEPVLNMIKSRKTNADLIMDYDIKDARALVDFFH